MLTYRIQQFYEDVKELTERSQTAFLIFDFRFSIWSFDTG